MKDCWLLFCRGSSGPGYYGIRVTDAYATKGVLTRRSTSPPRYWTVLIAGQALGFRVCPGALNPDEQFKVCVTARSARRLVSRAVRYHRGGLRRAEGSEFARGKQGEQAGEAQAAVSLAPGAVQSLLILGDVLTELGRSAEASLAYEKALLSAKTIEPEFQIRSIPGIEQKLANR